MANNILITPASASIQFSGSAANTIRLQVEDSGSVAFYGNSGSLFGISDNLDGSLMSVNDISGLPTLETFSDGKLVVSPYAFQTRSMGFGTDTPIGNFDFVNPLAENVDFYIRTTQGSSYNTALHIRGSRTTSTTDELANIRFETADTDAGGVELARISAIKDVASTNIARLEFKTTSTDGASPTTKMMISASGNVGIGTTSPTHKLEIVGNVSASSHTGSFSGDGSQVTGVVSSSYAISSSAAISASFATTASYVEGAASDWNTLTNKPAGLVSSSTQVNADSVTNFDTNVKDKLNADGVISSSGQVDYTGLSNIPSGIVSSSQQINTGSFTGSFSGDGSGLTGVTGVGGGVEIRDDGAIRGTAQILDFVDGIDATFASSTASISLNRTGSFTGSFSGDGSQLTNIASTFLDLSDTPTTYTSSGGYLLTVDLSENSVTFTNEIGIDELILEATTAPTSVASDSVSMYVTATGTTPNREVAYKIKNELGQEIIISSILV